MWRYRDYVIRAFNEDKPYERFIKEQLAGDELWPDDKEALIATGFLRSYPDEINARDLNLKKQEIAVDLTNTTGSVFLATTVGCANCHNHKFDKISQKEYFQLQAFFVNASARDDVSPVDGQGACRLPAGPGSLRRGDQSHPRSDGRRSSSRSIDKLEADRLQGFVPQTRASIEKPESERNAYDRWIYYRNLWTLTGRDRNAENELKTKDKEAYGRVPGIEAAARSLRSISSRRNPATFRRCLSLGRIRRRPTYSRLASTIGCSRRCNPASRRRWPTAHSRRSCPTATSSGRRTALANWIASPDNPLTARVIVNRIWAQYFGRGHRRVGQRLRQNGRQAGQSRVARLPGGYIREGRSLEHQEAAADAPLVERLSTVIGRAQRGARKRSPTIGCCGLSLASAWMPRRSATRCCLPRVFWRTSWVGLRCSHPCPPTSASTQPIPRPGPCRTTLTTRIAAACMSSFGVTPDIRYWRHSTQLIPTACTVSAR